jgi:hypothetical protein
VGVAARAGRRIARRVANVSRQGDVGSDLDVSDIRIDVDERAWVGQQRRSGCQKQRPDQRQRCQDSERTTARPTARDLRRELNVVVDVG